MQRAKREATKESQIKMPTDVKYMAPSLPKEYLGIDWERATTEEVDGVNVHIEDDYHRTPLYYAACWCEDINVINALIEKGAVVNYMDKAGYTPLHWAAECNKNHEVTNLLICRGACAKAKSIHKATILHWAARNENPKVAEILILHGANVKARDEGGDTPLHKAAWKDNHNVAELLVSHVTVGRDVYVNTQNKSGCTALHKAAINNSQKIAELLLLKYKANASIKDAFGRTAWEWGKLNQCFAKSSAGKLLEKATGKTSCHA